MSRPRCSPPLKSSRCALVLGAGLVIMTGLLVTCAVKTVRSHKTHREAFDAVSKINDYHRDLIVNYQDQQLAAITSMVLGNSESVLQSIEDAQFLYGAADRLESKLRAGMRRAPDLKVAKKAVKKYVDTVVFSLDYVADTLSTLFPVNGTAPDNLAFYFVVNESLSINTFTLRTILDGAVNSVLDEYVDISNESTMTSFTLTIVAFVVCYAALVTAACALVAVCFAWSAKIRAQDQLARQQAHEMRNKYAPAHQMMQQFIDTCDQRERLPRVTDFLGMRDDMQVALVVLREVETQIQTRLDSYKMLRGRYVENKESLDLVEFMRHRTRAEAAVAKALDRNSNVDFDFKLPAEYADCSEVYCQVDLYVLDHVVSNCLSNARKFTPPSGSVVLTFWGFYSSMLVFSVRDTGSGIPENIRSQLFRHEVTTGDRRGTGLGLPSCSLFCKSVGGFIKLKSTELCTGSKNGHTEIEFAVGGDFVTVVQFSDEPSLYEEKLEPISPPSPLSQQQQQQQHEDISFHRERILPNDLNIFIVDDSAVNRHCIERSLKKVAEATGCTEWTYSHFPTVEKAQPALRTPVKRGGDVNTLVTMDQSMMSLGGVMSGSDAIKWLRSSERNFKGVRVVPSSLAF